MWWRRRRAAAEEADADRGDTPAALIDALIAKSSDRVRASSLLSRVERFRKLRRAEQERELPAIYLLLEQYLIEVEGAPGSQREDLRRELGEHFPELCHGPLALVLAPPSEQQVLLGRRLLQTMVRRSRAILGAAEDDALANLDHWLETVPHARPPVPLLDRDHVPDSQADWIALLAEQSHALYRWTVGSLGERLAQSLIEESFEELADAYVALPTFPALVDLLPPEVLGERHIQLLSRAQMQRLLHGKIEELQQLNDRLAERGAKLQRTRQALLEANDQLERRVEARTAELEYALEALSRSEERFRSLATAAHEAIVMLDAGGRVCLWNRAATRMLGFEEHEILGHDPVPLLAPEDWRAPVAEIVGAVLRDGKGPGVGETHELEVPRRDGTVVPLELSLSAVRVGGEWHLVGVARDVSDRRRAEEERRRLERQIQQRQRLESLGVLAGGIAHDFNNLLTAILGHAEIAAGRLPAEAPAREDLGQIEEVAMRAADLTGQLLAYSGRGQFVVEAVDLTRLVRRMAKLVRVSISKRAQLRDELTDDLPAIDADRSQLQQVVLNLITNASDALADRDGTITVRTGMMTADRGYLDGCQLGLELAPGDYVFVEVEDTGVGMGAATAGRIFEPFFSTKRVGRGLGLAAVLGIVRGHQGAVRMSSEEGRGTTFRVLFPAERASRERPAASRPRGADWSGEGVALLVDDEHEVRRVARAMLENAGLQVLEAVDGEAGLELFDAHPEIDLVVLDLTMPKMDGEETLAAIRERGRVPVVLISGYTEEDLAGHLMSDGTVTFLQKPFTMSQLIGAARQALEGTPRAAG